MLNCRIANFGHVDRFWRDPFANRRHLMKTTFEEDERRVAGLPPLPKHGRTSKKDVGSSKGKGASSSSKNVCTECSSSDEDFSKKFCFKAPAPGLFASDSEDDFM